MEPISKDQSIVKQSSLKIVCEICNTLEYKPKSLAEILRINDIIVSYCLFGTQPEINTIVKRFDDHIKKEKKPK